MPHIHVCEPCGYEYSGTITPKSPRPILHEPCRPISLDLPPYFPRKNTPLLWHRSPAVRIARNLGIGDGRGVAFAKANTVFTGYFPMVHIAVGHLCIITMLARFSISARAKRKSYLRISGSGGKSVSRTNGYLNQKTQHSNLQIVCQSEPRA